MPNKAIVKTIPGHNTTGIIVTKDSRGNTVTQKVRPHKETYEPKLEMYVCGCGNRRELTIDERLQHGLIANTEKYTFQTFPVRIPD